MAEEEGSAILAFTNQDYKNMEYEVDRNRYFIEVSQKRFPKVDFRYTDAITAMRKCCDLKPHRVGMDCEVTTLSNGKKLTIKTNCNTFGSQPYLAFKTKDGRFIWDNLDNGMER